MAQLTIYLDADTQKKVEAAARRESVSLSRWARDHLARAADLDDASAWNHLSAFTGTVDKSFAIPKREGGHRAIPNLED
ncbi:MAG: hypothetical protein KGQ87_01070 [Verrucomicrobia bacterium]|nr:hypothetical protein [Verrucomicrobiota bacterium]